MADYIPISPDEYDPEAPLTSSLVSRIVNNPLAIAEGAPGAPRVDAGALAEGSVVTSAYADSSVTKAKLESSERMTNANVRSMTASSSVGAVGTYALLQRSAQMVTNPGGVVAGSRLRYASAAMGSDVTPSGSWRAMGFSAGGTGGPGITLFLRVS